MDINMDINLLYLPKLSIFYSLLGFYEFLWISIIKSIKSNQEYEF